MENSGYTRSLSQKLAYTVTIVSDAGQVEIDGVRKRCRFDARRVFYPGKRSTCVGDVEVVDARVVRPRARPRGYQTPKVVSSAPAVLGTSRNEASR